MISRFFIDRPIFASVLSLLITIAGTIAVLYLPVAQYPRITPPGVSISISYPGASAEVVASTIGAPIEQQVNGVEGMLYMSSQSGNDGSYSLTVTFDVGTDINTALVKVQNRVQQALPQLPSQAQNQGIAIRKKTPDMLMIVNFYSPGGRYNDEYLSNYATIYAKDELLRVEGISDINIQGQRDYSMRVWLDPPSLAARNMTAMDVADAIRSQNVDAPAGRIGQPPTASGRAFQFPLDALGRRSQPEEFREMIVKVGGRPRVLSGSGKPKPKAGTSGVAGPSSVTLSTPSATSVASASAAGTAASSTDSTATTGTSATATSTSSSPASSQSSPDPTGATPASTAPPAAVESSGVSAPAVGSSTNETAGGTVGAFGLAGGAMGVGMPSPSSTLIRLKDVARVDLGAQNYNTICTFDGKPSVGLGLFQLPGTNALEVADRVRKKMEELKASFPDDLDYKIAYDTTPYIRDSVRDVGMTLLEAVGLVAIVVLVFLQSWRAALIPLIAVPVAIVGTFAVMAAIGFSLNNISLFGLVLAIGIVVDDAIVVVENVERWMERGLSAREASRRAMDEVTGPIIAVGLVLCAVFIPCAFISGITGQFFRQFAVTIAVSTIFSTFNSLTLSPALAAILLKPKSQRPDRVARFLNLTLGWFFRLFNRTFEAGTSGYAWLVGKMMRFSGIVLIGYLGLLVLTVWTFRQAPTGFIPQQDQGRLIVNVQLPDSASLERTQQAVARIEEIARRTPGVKHTVCFCGTSFLLQASSPNFASMFVVLDPFDERRKPNLVDTEIMAKMRTDWANEVKDAQVTVFGAAPVPGLGVAGGFKFLLEDRGGLGVRALQDQLDGPQGRGRRAAPPGELKNDQGKEKAVAREGLVDRLKGLKSPAGTPLLNSATSQFRARIPQLYADIDRDKVARLDIPLDDVNQTMDIFLGSLYATSFNAFGRHWQVTLQAEAPYRSRVENIGELQVRNRSGGMVPLATLVNVREVGGPISVTRYNLYTSASVNGNIPTGVSTGEAISAINATADAALPRTMRIEWTELMFLQLKAGNAAIYVFFLAVVSVFLSLAALYESWGLPMAVILVVPLCLLCSVAGVLITHRDVNIFVQIGLVVLVGLACKNAILIVEFARQKCREGQPRYEATREASRLRLRPILMTSFAFIFGVLPLVVASGAGAEMRRSLGTAVFSGMLGVTLFGIFLTPVFFYVIEGLSEMSFFKSGSTRLIGSCLIGMGLGAAVGYLLGLLGVLRMPWALLIGAGVGLVVIMLVWSARQLSNRSRPSSGIGL